MTNDDQLHIPHSEDKSKQMFLIALAKAEENEGSMYQPLRFSSKNGTSPVYSHFIGQNDHMVTHT